MVVRATLLIACVTFLACGPGSEDAPDAGTDGATLVLAPASVELTVVDGAAVTQAFTATLQHPDGTTEDVTARTQFSIDRPSLGSFTGAELMAAGDAGGRGKVGALVDGLVGSADLTVRVERDWVVGQADPATPGLFDAATDDPALAPTIAYPQHLTVVPPNLGDFEVHWTGPAGSDRFEIAVTGQYVELRAYVASGSPGWASLPIEAWDIIEKSARTGELSIAVRGLSSAAPAAAGTSAPITVTVATQAIEGGIYYWAASAAGGAAGIYRHDMASPSAAAEAFYTTNQSPKNPDGNGRCVACHVLSRDGETMAITYDGGDGTASILDVATRTPMFPLDAAYWNFASFEPGAARIATASKGKLELRDVANGQVVSTLAGSTYATHPDFHPDGTAVVYVEAAAPTTDWVFTGGALMVAPFDPATGAFGTPAMLADDTSINDYYPSWSPDGDWVVFNRSSEDAYDDASAELWIVKADGSVGPIKLEAPNIGGGLTNSWARWTPFTQTFGEGELAEPVYWLTFSSKRAFGVRLPGGQPQIWMAPFFPLRALDGEDPSAPAFRLPIQAIDSNNHIAQWTEKVVPVE